MLIAKEGYFMIENGMVCKELFFRKKVDIKNKENKVEGPIPPKQPQIPISQIHDHKHDEHGTVYRQRLPQRP
jgi:hypothetical protein